MREVECERERRGKVNARLEGDEERRLRRAGTEEDTCQRRVTEFERGYLILLEHHVPTPKGAGQISLAHSFPLAHSSHLAHSLPICGFVFYFLTSEWKCSEKDQQLRGTAEFHRRTFPLHSPPGTSAPPPLHIHQLSPPTNAPEMRHTYACFGASAPMPPRRGRVGRPCRAGGIFFVMMMAGIAIGRVQGGPISASVGERGRRAAEGERDEWNESCRQYLGLRAGIWADEGE